MNIYTITYPVIIEEKTFKEWFPIRDFKVFLKHEVIEDNIMGASGYRGCSAYITSYISKEAYEDLISKSQEYLLEYCKDKYKY